MATIAQRTVVNRPGATAMPQGLLGCELFQTAYVVRDLDAAKDTFARQYGVRNFIDVPMPPMEGETSMRIGLAWVGGQQIELIEPKGPGLELYTDWMIEGRDIRHHHFGYFVHSDEEWNALEKRVADEGRTILMGGDGGICQFLYIDAPELGHYLEFVYPNEQGRAFFESVPAN